MQHIYSEGQQLGPYKLGKLLGQGGMGAVYEAYQPSVKRKVAIKLLPATLAAHPEYLRRFHKEVELIARLEHPHILPIYDFGSDQGISYIVMRLLTGGTALERYQSSNPPSGVQTKKLLLDIADALDHSHKRSIIHRDLKLSNILFDEEGRAYLADFGIAKVLQETTVGITGTGQVMGTPAYMAPEQWLGMVLDARTDVYAFGVVAYYLITGYEPFEAPTPYAYMHKHLNEMPTPPSVLQPQLSPQVDQVLNRAMAKDQSQRFSSTGEFARQLVQHLPDVYERPTRIINTILPSPQSPFTPRTPVYTPTRSQQSQGRRYWIAGAVTLLVVLLAAGLIYLTASSDDEKPENSVSQNEEQGFSREEVLATLTAEAAIAVSPTETATATDQLSETPVEITELLEATSDNSVLIAEQPTETATATPTSSETATSTATSIPPTNTLTATATLTATDTATLTPSETPSATVPHTEQPTETSTATITPSETFTALPPTETATDTPTNTPTASTSTLYILENVETNGGVEVFPLPDRSSGRLFAAVRNFNPHVAGRNEEGSWLYIYYFEGWMEDGWVPGSQLSLTDEEIGNLDIIDPENPPALPSLSYNEAAARPYGTVANTSATDAAGDPIEDTTGSSLPMVRGGNLPNRGYTGFYFTINSRATSITVTTTQCEALWGVLDSTTRTIMRNNQASNAVLTKSVDLPPGTYWFTISTCGAFRIEIR